MGGPQSRSGRGGGEEKNSQPLSGLEPLIVQPVAQRCTAELTRLPRITGTKPLIRFSRFISLLIQFIKSLMEEIKTITTNIYIYPFMFSAKRKRLTVCVF
jgi:hypothetical protein